MNISRVLTLAIFAMSTSHVNSQENWGAAGVLAYSRIGDEVMVLVGEEDRGWLGLVGGRNNGSGTKNGCKYEADSSIAETAAREFWEETRHAYDYSATLARLSTSYRFKTRDGAYVFPLKVAHIPSSTLNGRSDVCFGEKIQYCWVKPEELFAAIDSTPDENSGTIPKVCGGAATIHRYLYHDLVEGAPLRAFLQGVLETIRNP